MMLTQTHMSMMASRQYSELLKCGITASDLLNAGITVRALLDAGFTASELLDAGFTASALLDAGFTVSDLLRAGFTVSDLLRAGFTASALLDAGFTVRALLDAGITASELPVLKDPYTTILQGIKANSKIHDQNTFGPENEAANTACQSAMCTAGHLVSLAGSAGWKLRINHGWQVAAALIHEAAHPGWPCQNFDSIPQELALAYIREMAMHEENDTSPAKK